MKNYWFLFSILFFIGCGSTATEPAENTSTSTSTPVTKEIIQDKMEASNEVIDSKETMTEDVKENTNKEPRLSDNFNKKPKVEKETTVTKAKEEVINTKPKSTTLPTTKKETGTVVNQTPIKEVVTKVTTSPKPAPVKDAPKVITEKVEKIEAPKPAPKKETTIEVPTKVSVMDHSIFNGLLTKNVSSTGKVNYKGFKSAESTFNEYLNKLEKIKVSDLKGRNEKMAFWINAYNAYTIKLILKNYPLKSITNLDGGKPWDVKWIKLDGRTLSLNNIENDILRPIYKDPRIHFAVNCAAKSCPSLLNKAWTSSNLESLFISQTKKFINNSNFNKISKKKVEVSKIFDWYKADFGNLVNFLNKYSSTKINSDAKIEFAEYDWSLNE